MRTTLSVIAIAVASMASKASAETVVTLSFDDTFADQVQAGAMLAAHGLHGTFFINSPRIDQPTYMTSADVDSLVAAGHEIGGHTINHYRLATQSHDEVQRQICDDRMALLARGYTVSSFAYPKGSENDDVRAVAAACGYDAARDASGLHSQGFQICAQCAQAETIPPANPYLIRTPVSVKSQNTLEDLEKTVTVVEEQGGGWVPFLMHHVCDGCNTDSVSPAILSAFIDWLSARQAQGTVVRTIRDVVPSTNKPGVAGPAPVPYVAPDGNLLQNASFESNAFGSDLGPDCWRVGAGSNSTASVSPIAHSGSAAARIDVPAGATGGSSIYSVQDMGQCAPPANPGDVFHVSVWYQSVDAVKLVAFYRIASGWWVYWTAGHRLPSAPSYTQAEWTTPPLPAGATAVAVGITLEGGGSVLLDDVQLVRVADGAADGGTTSNDNHGGCAMASPRPTSIAWLAAGAALLLLMRRRWAARR